MEAFKLIADLGFSIAAVIGGGFFIVSINLLGARDHLPPQAIWHGTGTTQL